MAKLKFENKWIEVESGITLRKALLANQISPHNGSSKWLNCKGLGTCGTCAVKLQGHVSPPNAREKWRLNFPPFKQGLNQGFRLACQTQILGDCQIEKGEGFWGEISKESNQP